MRATPARTGADRAALAPLGHERWLPHLSGGAADIVLKPLYENLLSRDPKTDDLMPMVDPEENLL